MFAPPPAIETEVFARLPEKYRKAGEPSAWLTAQLRGAPMHSLLEGPAFDRNGTLYVVDIPFGRVLRSRRPASSSSPPNTTANPMD